MDPGNELRIENLAISFGRLSVIRDFSLTVPRGDFVALVGPSGCGKSSILNAVAGLLPYTTGRVTVFGSPVQGLNPEVGYVTQSDSLLPWLTLQGNVEVALELRGMPRDQRGPRALQVVESVGLHGFERYYPHQLSGGMRQRGNIARALAYDAPTFLMDEPFGALDSFTRAGLQSLLATLWQTTGKTVLFVTHDIWEALILAERVVVIQGQPGIVAGVFLVRAPRPRTVEDLINDPAARSLYGEISAALSQGKPRSRAALVAGGETR